MVAKADEKDTTLENVEIVEKIEVEVDRKQVEVGITKDGEPRTAIPEEIADDDEKVNEYLVKVTKGVENLKSELSKTLSRGKQKRTEQNAQQEELNAREKKLKIREDRIKTQESEIKTDRERYIDQGLSVNYESIYDTEMRKILGVESDTEINDIMQDEPGKWRNANTKAQATATAKMYATSRDSTLEKARSDINAQLRRNQIINLINNDKDYKINPADVIAFAEAQKISHLEPTMVYNLYKTQHPQRNIKKEFNWVENIKSTNVKPIVTGLKTVRKKGDPFKGMTQREIEALPDDDPRIIEERERMNAEIS